ncbi:MAG: Hsp33 family molecular chaperone HslO [Pseudomonadota bacterium]|nr:Hsp33 family molecular chaperone HslO [Pseudomonadota bacterium]
MKKSLPLRADLVQPFQLESTALRGRLVRLGSLLDIILHQHSYPKAVATLLAESIVIAAALGHALKYEGVFTFQAKGDGPVRLLVVDVTDDGGMRAYAQVQEGHDFMNAAPDTRLLGKGFLAFTVDQKNKDDRYQGIVALEGGTLAEAVQHYFRQSEQLPTGIVSAVDQDEQGRWTGGCLMVQRMPREGGTAHVSDTALEDDWYRVMTLMGTCKPAELTDRLLPANDLLYRLFHEEGVRVYEPHPYRHECRCSEMRVTSMLRALPRQEIEQLAVDGLVTVTCEFCNRSYKFDDAAREKLYADLPTDSPGKS